MTDDAASLHHSALVGRMAYALDVDFGAVLLDRDLTDISFPAMVAECRKCRAPVACVRWLDAHMAGAKFPPGYCRNRAVFARLTAAG